MYLEEAVGGMGVQELRELRQLREENGGLKRLVADLSLDRQILQEIVSKKLSNLASDAGWRGGHRRHIESRRDARPDWCRNACALRLSPAYGMLL
jgi:hypothetical protein